MFWSIDRYVGDGCSSCAPTYPERFHLQGSLALTLAEPHDGTAPSHHGKNSLDIAWKVTYSVAIWRLEADARDRA
jgi:hypothetical protein